MDPRAELASRKSFKSSSLHLHSAPLAATLERPSTGPTAASKKVAKTKKRLNDVAIRPETRNEVKRSVIKVKDRDTLPTPSRSQLTFQQILRKFFSKTKSDQALFIKTVEGLVLLHRNLASLPTLPITDVNLALAALVSVCERRDSLSPIALGLVVDIITTDNRPLFDPLMRSTLRLFAQSFVTEAMTRDALVLSRTYGYTDDIHTINAHKRPDPAARAPVQAVALRAAWAFVAAGIVTPLETPLLHVSRLYPSKVPVPASGPQLLADTRVVAPAGFTGVLFETTVSTPCAPDSTAVIRASYHLEVHACRVVPPGALRLVVWCMPARHRLYVSDRRGERGHRVTRLPVPGIDASPAVQTSLMATKKELSVRNEHQTQFKAAQSTTLRNSMPSVQFQDDGIVADDRYWTWPQPDDAPLSMDGRDVGMDAAYVHPVIMYSRDVVGSCRVRFGVYPTRPHVHVALLARGDQLKEYGVCVERLTLEHVSDLAGTDRFEQLPLMKVPACVMRTGGRPTAITDPRPAEKWEVLSSDLMASATPQTPEPEEEAPGVGMVEYESGDEDEEVRQVRFGETSEGEAEERYEGGDEAPEHESDDSDSGDPTPDSTPESSPESRSVASPSLSPSTLIERLYEEAERVGVEGGDVEAAAGRIVDELAAFSQGLVQCLLVHDIWPDRDATDDVSNLLVESAYGDEYELRGREVGDYPPEEAIGAVFGLGRGNGGHHFDIAVAFAEGNCWVYNASAGAGACTF
ncbi:hypothetical protein J8273_2544 [Carpediemonas membranifera]|uniref:Uncharacterized protein n=1 Tax=Carpediemonas membranifera TaxID=201153 RepID=A0A8J6BF69_9EUKA|nr:hypothetical protein J8273_2544 [Carpediemonas membranifera]|eukprot:KAG9396192.1 hypothetical protein J8273_2544 [Carpediemonas membranifera]